MALRVLLADESTTIKKVMQLALQDFAVEVKAVHVGVDVVAVARQFQPDIIFADVLLQKKNGYEVCTDLKQDPDLRSTPVVLMWSSFMDLDEALAANCGADRRLEKPFDIENLRQLLLELVPKTHTQRLAHFLKFPASFSDPMRKEEAAKQNTPPQNMSSDPIPAPPAPERQKPRLREQPGQPSAARTATPAEAPVRQPEARQHSTQEDESPAWNMDSFEDISAFEKPLHEVEQVEAPNKNTSPRPAAPSLRSASPNVPELEVPMSGADDDDDDDEVFSELRLQEQSPDQMASGHYDDVNHEAPDSRPDSLADSEEANLAYEGMTLTREIPMPSPRASAADESDDPWSHQDLSRFKVDLPPVTASNPEHGIDLEIPETSLGDYPQQQAQTLRSYEADSETPELGDTQNFDSFSFGGHHPQSQRKTPLHPDEIAQAEEEVVPNFEIDDGDLQLASQLHDSDQSDSSNEQVGGHFTDEATEAISSQKYGRQASREPRIDADDFSSFDAAKIPQLSPERLEQIIRAQAREIVEAVVRKIVPDLATDIIREELQRLLEDTASFEGREAAYGSSGSTPTGSRDPNSRGRIR